MRDVEFAEVPAADPTSVVDPHWLELRGQSGLPLVYLPPSMPGSRSRATRIIASALVAVFVVATAAGVCLTYGPETFGR